MSNWKAYLWPSSSKAFYRWLRVWEIVHYFVLVVFAGYAIMQLLKKSDQNAIWWMFSTFFCFEVLLLITLLRVANEISDKWKAFAKGLVKDLSAPNSSENNETPVIH